MKKIVYLTFNDAPSGIYSGQVIDVCRYWQDALGFEVTLIAFLSVRGFSENRKKISNGFPRSLVKRMMPLAGNWRMNRFILGRLLEKLGPDVIVARGPFAGALALGFRKNRKICFDSRGAYTAELNEYNVIPDKKIKNSIEMLERKVLLESDFRLAVSEALVNYWRKKFDYNSDKHVVVPCTLNSRMPAAVPNADETGRMREKFGFSNDDIIIVYSGSGAGWQSLSLLDETIYALFQRHPHLKLLLLLKQPADQLRIKKEFPTRVKQLWLDTEKVTGALAACDYGWLVRENSLTNTVASPVKFAEYLSAGLRIIISPGLGDYSSFVELHAAGMILDPEKKKYPAGIAEPGRVSLEEKQRLVKLSSFFTKEMYREKYLTLLG